MGYDASAVGRERTLRAAVLSARGRRISALRNLGARLCAGLVPGVSSRRRSGLFLQGSWLLPVVWCAAHGRDGGALGGSRDPGYCAGAAVGAVLAVSSAVCVCARSGRACCRASHLGAGSFWLLRTCFNPGGGTQELRTDYVVDVWGDVTEVKERVGSAQELATVYDYDGTGRLLSASRTVDGVPLEDRFYYDKWGNLVVALSSNKTSTGAAPDDFHPTTPRNESARAWLREEWHYDRGRLLSHFVDRRPLDRDDLGAVADAAGSRLSRSDYSWTADGWLRELVSPSGRLTRLTYDGFGVPFKKSVIDPAGGELTVSRTFVNNALLPTRVVDGNGVVTTIERSPSTGMVVSVAEPATDPATLPGNYPWAPAAPTQTSVVRDSMGRTTEVVTSVVGGAALVRRKATYDQIGRAWRSEVFEGVGAVASQTYLRQWTGSRLTRVEGLAGRHKTIEHDVLGRVSVVGDSAGADPNKIEYDYFARSPFPSSVTHKNWDAAAATPGYVSRARHYERDVMGRVKTMKVARSDGQSGTLDHSFSYYSTGDTESYTDPTGKVEQYLPDALGRLAERFMGGAQPIWNGTQYIDWMAGARSEVVQIDGLGHETRTTYDYAGRPTVVMEPGATVVPKAATPHQAFTRFMEYDAASRLSRVHTSEAIEIALHRDAVGRVLQRDRVQDPAALNLSAVSSLWDRDNLRRNSLGQVVETNSFTLGDDEYIHETFGRDALGRTSSESFDYVAGVGGPEVASSFVGGDTFRSGVSIDNAATADDLAIEYTPDAIGRVASIGWGVGAVIGPPLASYLHEGGAIRRRTTNVGLGLSPPNTTFHTDYSYDAFGRMDSIDQSFASSPSALVEFHYDDASNLIKEVYEKHGGQAGDQFAYDEHHRLQSAWMGSDTANLADPATGTFVKKLTYGLDEVHNRSSVSEQVGTGSPTTTAYSLDATSNRYDTVGGVTLAYDERGNLIYDGFCLFVYDALNRLTEVFAVTTVSQQQASSSTSTAASSSGPMQFAVSDMSALRAARATILQRVLAEEEVVDRANDSQLKVVRTEPLSSSAVSPVGSTSTQESILLVQKAWYLYDAMNRRVTRWVGEDGTYFYAWDGWQQAQELVFRQPAGVLTAELKQFVWGEQLDELIAYRRSIDTGASWTNFYIAEGGAHCPSRVLDEAGNVVEVQEYDPYGKVEFFSGGIAYEDSQFGNKFGWRGVQVDRETGLLYMRNRYYNPEVGRFVSRDPLGVAADPVTWLNAYNFGSASPLVQSDPFGLQMGTSQGQTFYFNPGSGQYGTQDATAQTFNVGGFRDANSGKAVDDWGQVGNVGPENIQWKNPDSGEWHDMTASQQQWMSDTYDRLDAAIRIRNMMLAQVGMFAGVALGNAAVTMKLPGASAPKIPARPCPKTSASSARNGKQMTDRGASGETRVRGRYDIGSKTKINVNGRGREPDGLNATTLSEVKNTKALSYTQQLRDYAQYAQDTGREFVLYLRNPAHGATELSGPLQNAVNEGLILLRPIPLK